MTRPGAFTVTVKCVTSFYSASIVDFEQVNICWELI